MEGIDGRCGSCLEELVTGGTWDPAGGGGRRRRWI